MSKHTWELNKKTGKMEKQKIKPYFPKAVLIVVSSTVCERVAERQQKALLRFDKPDLEFPFIVYLCCDVNKGENVLHTYITSGYGRKNFGITQHWRSGLEIVDVNAHLPQCRYNAYLAEGKVFGEFICNNIEDFTLLYGLHTKKLNSIGNTFFTVDEIQKFARCDKTYKWDVSNLIIYDVPKPLSEFREYGFKQMYEKYRRNDNLDCFEKHFEKLYVIKKTPKSIRYVEELVVNG